MVSNSTARRCPRHSKNRANLVWGHLCRILASAEMTVDDLVSLRFYQAEPASDPTNVALLKRHLDGHRTARTVICCQLLEPAWLIEIEAIAARED